MRAAARLIVLIASMALAQGACRNSRSGAAPDSKVGLAAAAAPVVVLDAGGRALSVRVELATTEAQRERGLMYRNRLEPGAGMLFVFERDAPLTFWMKNTFIPLDMIFIGGDRKIVGIVANATPETETPRHVDGLSRYVLEISGGMSEQWGVTAGSTVEFRGIPADVLGAGEAGRR